MDGQARKRRVFPLVYYYKQEKVSVCLFVCLFIVLYSRELGFTDWDKPYIFGIPRILGRSSERKFQKKRR